MDADPRTVEEPPEKAVASIAAALDFLEREAKTAGLAELGDLIRQASTRAKQHALEMPTGTAPRASADIVAVCKAIVGLPPEYRDALVFKKVYGRSYEQIADDLNVSVDTAKARVMKGFELARALLPPQPDRQGDG